MIEFTTGNIFDTDCTAIGHGCNCEGKAGKGIITQIKSKYPKAIQRYKAACRLRQFHPGIIQVVDCGGKYIVNMGTQEEIRRGKTGGAKEDWIRICLEKIENKYKICGFDSIAFPKIGCGLGGLAWDDIKLLFKEIFENSELKVIVYE